MKKLSVIYRNRFIYNILIRFLYGRNYKSRFEKISINVRAGISILELCFGDLYLYENYLKKKKIDYTGIDLSSVFVRYANKKGINAICGDVRDVKFPSSHTVIMQASLMHFSADDELILEKMFKAATHRIIISEPIVNLAQSHNKFVSTVARYFVNDPKDPTRSRYDKNTLLFLFNKFIQKHETEIASHSMIEIDGKRELVFVVDKHA